MSRRTLAARRVAASLTCAFIALPALALDWPQWRGPERNGKSQEEGLLREWPEGGPPLVWEVLDLGAGYSTPVVVGDRIYMLGSEGLDNEFVLALNTADGSEIWKQPIGKVGNPDQRPPYPGARSTPTVDGDRLYVLGSDGDFACLEAEGGAIVWNKNVRTEFGGKPGVWAYSESPLVDGDLVLCTPGGAEATMLALNKADGSVAWQAPLAEADDAGYSSIVIATIGGVKQYVQFMSKGVVGIDAATHEELWRYNRTAEGSPANIPTPTIKDNLIYTAAGRTGGGLAKVNVSDGRFEAEEVYFEGNLPKAIGGTILLGDHMYGTSDALMCVEFATGEVAWRERSIGTASLCYADGRLYLHGENGEVALVDPSPEEYREVGRFTPPNVPDRGNSKAWAYPVVAGGRLYIFDSGTLWCFDVKG
jgi:outer membrane protein assembly factor BamB